MYRESPGSIKYQLGMSLGRMLEASAQGDVYRKADLFQYTVTLCAPHLTPEDEQALRKLPPIPAKDRYGLAERTLNESIDAKLGDLLRKMAAKNIYAWIASEPRDGSELDELGRAPADEEDEGAPA